ncbi:hypothetical protein [Streptomyces sp. B6B3]|uniref:hypothetical protein n=1 Tax=Streptomyces sp. B6B3 TaxID=3153570 RepID=UPI00325D58C3
MVAELAAGLAVTAAGAAVAAMVTDAWGGTRERIVALWRRLRPEEEAEEVARGLDQSRQGLGEAVNPFDPDREQRIREALAGRFRDLLERHPEAADEVRALIAAAEGDGDTRERSVTHIHVSGRHNSVVGSNSGVVVNNFGRESGPGSGPGSGPDSAPRRDG